MTSDKRIGGAYTFANVGRLVRHRPSGDLAEVTGFYGHSKRLIRSVGTHAPHIVPLDEIEAAFVVGDEVRVKPSAPHRRTYGVVETVNSDRTVVIREGNTGCPLTVSDAFIELDPWSTLVHIRRAAEANARRVDADLVSRETKSHSKRDKRGTFAIAFVVLVIAVAFFGKRG